MSDVNDAFLLLQEAIDKEIASIRERGAEAFRSGDLTK